MLTTKQFFTSFYATNCPVFIIEITNTKFKLHTPSLYYIWKEKWKQMKPKKFLSCPVLTAVDALSSCKKCRIETTVWILEILEKGGYFWQKCEKMSIIWEKFKIMPSFGKNDKQKVSKVGKNLRNKRVRNSTPFLFRRECVY